MARLTLVLASLRPGLNCVDNDGTLGGVSWQAPLPADFVPPTQAEVDTERARLDDLPRLAAAAAAEREERRALDMRRARKLEASDDVSKQLEGLRLRVSLIDGG